MSSGHTFSFALAGNPNAGKTSAFNALTGAHQHVGNYPGVTVERKEGTAHLNGNQARIVDLPGTYSLTAYSLEELVARNYIIGQRPEVIINVVDAANLERNLYLTVQLLELGAPLVLCLNMVDVAEQRGIAIDVKKLSAALGIPVVPTVARAGKGMDQLMQAAMDLAREKPPWKPLEISYGPDVDQGLKEITAILQGDEERKGLLSARWLALKCMEEDRDVMGSFDPDSDLGKNLLPVIKKVSRHIESTMDDGAESIIADYRYGFISAICRQAVISHRELRLNFSDKLDRVLTNQLLGPILLFAVLYLVYQFVFWASEAPVAVLEGGFGWLGTQVEASLPPGLLRSLLVSGIIDGVGGVLGFAPLIMFMFFAIAFMEDTGYMARVAYIMDRVLRIFGLHGNSVLALIVSGGISGGCAVPGVMATRTLKDPQARLATILVVPMMNCGAKLPVYAVLIGAFFSGQKAQIMFALTIISWGLALVAAKVLRSTVLKGEQAPFVMELPPYRLPTLQGLLIHTWERTWQYVKKAGTVILGVSILIWAAMTFPGLPAEQNAAFDKMAAQAQGAEQKARIEGLRSGAALRNTVAGRLGRALTVVTEPLGFDWRTNVALVGGVAAKEVIVSSLGTAYSLGGAEGAEDVGLSRRLAAEKGWNALNAFTLMIFVMLYAPCFVTMVAIKKETGSWGWSGFAMLYTTAVAYTLALIVRQTGMALGLG